MSYPPQQPQQGGYYPPPQPQQGYYPPQPYAYPYAAPQPQNGMGNAGFVCGLLALLFSWIPVFGIVSWPLSILGVVLGFTGHSKAEKGQANNGGLALTGAILGGLGLIVCIIWVMAVAAP